MGYDDATDFYAHPVTQVESVNTEKMALNCKSLSMMGGSIISGWCSWREGPLGWSEPFDASYSSTLVVMLQPSSEALFDRLMLLVRVSFMTAHYEDGEIWGGVRVYAVDDPGLAAYEWEFGHVRWPDEELYLVNRRSPPLDMTAFSGHMVGVMAHGRLVYDGLGGPAWDELAFNMCPVFYAGLDGHAPGVGYTEYGAWV